MLGPTRTLVGLLLAGIVVRPAWGDGRPTTTGRDQAGPAVTFTRDVAPILYAHCIVCHHTGGLAPFPLLTYDDARPWARSIRRAISGRSMPPWKPAPGHGGPFQGERRLSDDAIRLIERWVDGGALEGDPSDVPPAPALPSGWHLGPPDLVVTMPEPYLHKVGSDDYRNFVVPIPVSSTRYVRGFEFRPRGPGVHHARILIDRTGSARRRDREDPEQGYDDRLGDGAQFPTGHLMAWAPGKIPAFTPDEIAWRLDPGSDLVVQLHLPAVITPTPVQVEVGFYFADRPPARTPAVLVLGNKTIDIPAGDARHLVEDLYRLPVDVDVLAVYPHAHYLGRDLSAYATLPDGAREWLVRIEDWDFNWQDEYRYVEPMHLPRGTTVHLRYVYDNSAGNARNIHRLTRVRYGRRSTDEMAELVLQVLTGSDEDHEILTADYARKAIAVDIAGAEKRLRDEPGHFGAHHELALYYLEAGRLADARARFERALDLNPGFAPAHYNLGLILAVQGQPDRAADRYRRALALDPRHAEAHANLGALSQVQGRLDEAIEHYRRSIEIAPDLANAHHNLAVALEALGRTDEAVASYRRALAIAPDDARVHFRLAGALAGGPRPAEALLHYRRAAEVEPGEPAYLNGLAWILATHPDDMVRNGGEAVRFAERAAQLTGRGHALVLDTLAAAYAETGRYAAAVETVKDALALLPAGEAADLAARMRGRLQLYSAGRAFRSSEPQ